MIDEHKVARVEDRLDAIGALDWARVFCALQGARLCECVAANGPGGIAVRDPRVGRVRHRLWCVLLDTLGLSLPEAGRVFEVHHTTVQHAWQRRQAELEAEHWASSLRGGDR